MPSPLVSRNLATGRVVPARREQLDVGVGHRQQGLLHPVALDDLPVGHRGAERLLVPLDGGVEVPDGDGHVVDFGERHATRVPPAGDGLRGPAPPVREALGLVVPAGRAVESKHARFSHRRRRPHPDRQAVGCAGRPSPLPSSAPSPSGPPSTRAGTSPDEVDYVIMGQVLLAGTGQVPARQAATRPRDPDDHSGRHRQQGLPFRAQRHLPGRPDDRRRRRRDRGGRGHGVHDRGAPPPARRPPGLPAGRRDPPRRPHVRRARGRPHPRGHGPRQRALPPAVPGRDPGTPGRLRGVVPRTSRPGNQGRRCSRAEIVPVEVPQRRGDPLLVETDEGIRPGTTVGVAGGPAAGVRPGRHASPPATPRRSPTGRRRWW